MIVGMLQAVKPKKMADKMKPDIVGRSSLGINDTHTHQHAEQ